MVEVLNLQTDIKIGVTEFKKFASMLTTEVTEARGRSFSVAFISDERMRELNHLFRGKDSTTDVLSFPREADEFDPDQNDLGDIAISTETALRQAEENGLTLENEIKQLMLHGVLHLCGYDHEIDSGEMNARELELRDRLGI